MIEDTMQDEDFDQWEIDKTLKYMSKWTWYICKHSNGTYCIPDTTADLGHDNFGVFNTQLWQCRPAVADDTIQAYPSNYLNDPAARDASLVVMKFGNLKAGYIPYIGSTQPKKEEVVEKVIRPKDVVKWVLENMGNLIPRREITRKALQAGISELEIYNVLDAMAKKGLIYAQGDDIIRV